MIRQWVYRDYYHPNVTSDDFEEWSIHAGKKYHDPYVSLLVLIEVERPLSGHTTKRCYVSRRYDPHHFWMGEQAEADAEHTTY